MTSSEYVYKLKKLSEQVLTEITSDRDAFKNFLDFQSRLYKYKSEEALLIYAQKPSATACATFEQWNSEKVSRRINKGTKAIHVLDNDNIKYLFDLSDTNGKAFLYQNNYVIEEEQRKPLLKSFEIERYDEEDFNVYFVSCSVDYGYEKYQEKAGELDVNLETRNLIVNSVGYMLSKRYNIPIDIYLSEDAWKHIKILDKEEVRFVLHQSQQIAKESALHIDKIIGERVLENGENNSTEIRIRGREIDNRRSNGIIKGTQHNVQNRQIQLDMEGIYDGGISREIGRTEGEEITYTDGGTGTSGSNRNANNISETIQREKSKTNRGIHGNIELRTDNETTDRRTFDDGDSLQEKIENFKGKDTFFEINKSLILGKENFKIQSENDISMASGKTKFKQNFEAIKLMQKIEEEDRTATIEEQKILALYSGFGGIPQAFDNNHKDWSKEYDLLHQLVNDKQYEFLRGSTLNAHYTNIPVIQAMYKGLEELGFKGGNILEPSMGSGNFFGALPKHWEDKTKLYGVELDDITGRIARQLYPNANIEIKGFEGTNYQDNFFDVAIGNVPFGNYKVYDTKFNKHNMMIHDYFFAKALDKVKPYGVVAFITTKGTLDKENNHVRKYLAERAELLGAIRLPNDAFNKSANTKVTTDILFLRKRDRVIDATEEQWVYTGLYNTGYKNEEGVDEVVPLNQYFVDNPKMMLGEMHFDKSMYGNDRETSLFPFSSEEKSTSSLSELLDEAISFLPKNIFQNDVNVEDIEISDTIPADPNVKNYSFTIIDEKIYRRENSIMHLTELPNTTIERVKILIGIREVTKKLLEIQLAGCTDEELREQQKVLNDLYDKFKGKFGQINSKYNIRLFGEDAEFPLISSLEIIKSDEEVVKADIFTKRTLKPYKAIESVETSVEALAVSLNEKGYIDINFMSNISNKNNTEVIDELRGIIFKNPILDSMEEEFGEYSNWETSDEYLSGDVVEKLDFARKAAEENEIYRTNVTALENVQPIPLQAQDISVKLGAHWIDTKYYEQFIKENFNPSGNESYQVRYLKHSNNWHINKPYMRYSSVEATEVFGTKRMDAYALMENLLNQGSPKIYNKVYDGEKEKRVLNKAETIAIKNKATALNETFKRWIFEEPTRREMLVEKYNRLFNSERVRQFDGSFLRFEGMNPHITLREHQKNAVARILFNGNTLLAHTVGAGKTYTMAASAMEMKRLGLSNKPCFVVPNHLVNQWANEFKALYPMANVLVATKRDCQKERRQRLLGRIATGEWDAIIIGHSSFGKIPVSIDRQVKKIEKELKMAKEGLEKFKEKRDDRLIIKDLEKSVKRLETKLKTLNDMPKDNVINFEHLGIDSLFVDEAHMFKNKFMFTKMGNIAGLGKSDSQKAYDLELKCDYINEINGSERGVVFATGTPISNSMVELYTMQSYLQKKLLAKKGFDYFDNWAAQFGQVISSLELAPSGQGFKMRDRFSKFDNLPELMTYYRMVADIQTADMLNLPVPDVKDGKPITITAEPSEAQRSLINVLVELSNLINNKAISPEFYNMLTVTNDGRLGALDMRSINIDKFEKLSQYYDIDISGLANEDYEFSKVNACVNKVFDIYKTTQEGKLTQMIFCDISIPKGGAQFSVYDDIKEKLIQKGLKGDEIEFIHNAKTDEEKEKMFGKVRTGEVRVLLGSTQRMGAGTNCQTRLVALHHLDCPWRPSDLEQREGRIVRQGNENKEVQIYNYVTKGTFDAYLWQIVENKQKFIAQVMTGKTPSRNMEEVDASSLNYAEVKAIATGNPKIRRKMELEIEAQRLKVLEQQFLASKYNLQDKIIKSFPMQISGSQSRIKNLERDIELRDSNTKNDFFMKLGKNNYTERKEVGNVLLQVINSNKYIDKVVGEINGFKIIPQVRENILNAPKIILKGNVNHVVELSESEVGSIQRIENIITNLNGEIAREKEKLLLINQQLEASNIQVTKSFEHEKELKEVTKELEEINNDLDIGKDDNVLVEENEVDTKGLDIDKREEDLEL